MPRKCISGFAEAGAAMAQQLDDNDLLNLFTAVGRVVSKRFLMKRPCLDQWQLVIDYLTSAMGVRATGAVPRSVPRQAQQPDRRRGPGRRHGRSYTCLSAGGPSQGDRATRHRLRARAQSPVRRCHAVPG